jgi:hypothetical protein
MRTIPTILAAAAIVAMSTVLSAPAAHAGDKCDQFLGNPSAYQACESQQPRLNKPVQTYLPNEYEGQFASASPDGDCGRDIICLPPCNLYLGPGNTKGHILNPYAEGKECSDDGKPGQ